MRRLRPLPSPADAARTLLALAAAWGAGATARAEEGLRPGAGSPFAVRDAFVQPLGELNLQGILGYARGRGGTDATRINPSLKYGIGNGLELRLGGAYTFGDSASADLGEVTTGVRWRIFDQEGWRPTMALLGQVSFPSGPGDQGTTTELMAIASRVTGRGPGHWGLHLNAGWLARPDPGSDERRHGYRLGAAVSHVLDTDTLLVAAYVRETQDRDERALSLVEAGFQRSLGDGVTFALVAGTGLDRDSPALRLRAGLGWTFSTGR